MWEVSLEAYRGDKDLPRLEQWLVDIHGDLKPTFRVDPRRHVQKRSWLWLEKSECKAWLQDDAQPLQRRA